MIYIIQGISSRRQLYHLQSRIHAVGDAQVGQDIGPGGGQAKGAVACLIEDWYEALVELLDLIAEGDVDVGEGPVVGDLHGDGAAGKGPFRPVLGRDGLVDVCACSQEMRLKLVLWFKRVIDVLVGVPTRVCFTNIYTDGKSWFTYMARATARQALQRNRPASTDR